MSPLQCRPSAVSFWALLPVTGVTLRRRWEGAILAHVWWLKRNRLASFRAMRVVLGTAMRRWGPKSVVLAPFWRRWGATVGIINPALPRRRLEEDWDAGFTSFSNRELRSGDGRGLRHRSGVVFRHSRHHWGVNEKSHFLALLQVTQRRHYSVFLVMASAFRWWHSLQCRSRCRWWSERMTPFWSHSTSIKDRFDALLAPLMTSLPTSLKK